jgi:DNA ligase-1
MVFKPMLAAPADFDILRFPVFASVKIDGIRATIHNGVAMSRSMKPLPNLEIQVWAAMYSALEGLDGEFTVGPANAKDVFNVTTQHVMAAHKTGVDFAFHVFDVHCAPTNTPYRTRLRVVETINLPVRARSLPQTLIYGMDGLNAFEEAALVDGYEGVMIRDPNGTYKEGRSTAKEQGLLKVKRVSDMEAVVIGFEERMHNNNGAFQNELGRTARSTAQSGMVGTNALGALVVRGLTGPFKDVEFNVGTGFSEQQRLDFWRDRYALVNNAEPVRLTYFEVGSVDRPRHPVFVGFRDERDMDAAE